MPRFRVLITDLTDYGSSLRCVAGWDLDNGQMIRPEPRPAAFWDEKFCGPGRVFNPGNIVVFNAEQPIPLTDLPHLNEDKVVQGDIAIEQTLSRAEFVSALKGVGSVTAEQAFAAPVQFVNSKGFVRTGTNHPSLRGVLLKSTDVTFSTEKFGNAPAKARCMIRVARLTYVNLSIAGHELREVFRGSGKDGLARLFAGNCNLHLRLGLARGWGDYPDRCYMQVNGLYRL